INDFKAATQIQNGSAVVRAKANTKFTGEVIITIKSLDKTELSEVVKTIEVDGNIANDAVKVLEEIEAKNLEVKGAIEINDFKAATQIQNGSAVVRAKANTKFTGEVIITIKSLDKTELSDVIKNTEVDGNIANDAAKVLEEIEAKNSEVNGAIEINDFKAATNLENGSAIISAKSNTKFTGKVNIIVTTIKLQLSEVFSNFKFTDEKNVQGFLDNNNLDSITNKILSHIGASSLDEAGLSLENHSSNSILVKAKPDSKYRGDVKLTWNLKLFEISGIGANASNVNIKNGLKGYIYLDSTTNKIKFFDVVKYFQKASVQVHQNFIKYHTFNFSGQKDFTFNGRTWVDNLPNIFGSLEFIPGSKITVDSPELHRILVFDKSTNKWQGLTKKTEFILNELGDLTKSN
ncbi:hypothetical protein, partial [Spiroplasma platyhelix]